jgi:hypothetical protein
MAGMSESPEEMVPKNPANDAGMQRPAHRTGRAPQGKHMTVAGARDAGQCPEDLKDDGREVTKERRRMKSFVILRALRGQRFSLRSKNIPAHFHFWIMARCMLVAT